MTPNPTTVLETNSINLYLKLILCEFILRAHKK